MRENIRKVQQIRVKSDRYEDGYHDYPFVLERFQMASSTGLTGILLSIKNEKTDPASRTMPLSKKYRKWILDFVKFLDNCGGYEQW